MCMVDLADCMPSVSSTALRRARKEHTCGECGRPIARGETYRYDTHCTEGHWYDFRTCAHCQVAIKWLSDNCGGWLFGGVLEDIDEHVHEYPTLKFGLLRLSVGMRRSWRGFGGGLLPVQPAPRSISSFVEAA